MESTDEKGKLQNLKKLLENEEWPLKYTFKFIIPSDRENEVILLVPGAEVSVRPSSKGAYVAVTLEKIFVSSGDIIDIYQKASKISGLLSL